jgi:hypothetical protein
VIRKSPQIGAADVALPNRERLGPHGSLFHEEPEFAVEIIGELARGDPLVLLHDLREVGVDSRVKNRPHQSRRRATC